MRLLDDEDVDLALVEHVLMTDPAMVTTLLRVANSALYCPVRPVASVHDAMKRIGTRSVRDLVIGVASMGMFRDARGVAQRFLSHCVRVSAINRVLATEWGRGRADDAFLCGLLHDVGKLLTHQVSEMSYAQLTAEALRGPDRVHRLERAKLGYDHAVLGAHVLDAWRLPSSVVTTVAFHHNSAMAWEHSSEVGLNVSLLRMADAIEYELERHPGGSAAFCEQLARSPEAQYADLDPSMLEAMWPKFEHACRQLDAALVG